MKNIKRCVLGLLLMLVSGFGVAWLDASPLRVVTAYPYIREVVIQVGGDRVSVEALAKGQWDPHVVVPKPSLIALVRRADLLIMNGAQLEIGWMPPLIQQANNPTVRPSSKGFIDLSEHFELIQKPDTVSRAQGDIHPAGNPHFYLDPHNILRVAELVAGKLTELDPQGREFYASRLERFQREWTLSLDRWEERMAPLKGKKVVQYHRNFDYFLIRYGIDCPATVELLPGIPPTSRHILGLIEQVRREGMACIIHDVYHNDKSSRYLAKETGITMVMLPHDVEALPGTETIQGLFDTIVDRMVNK